MSTNSWRTLEETDDFLQKIVKYIPIEIIGAYQFLAGIFNGAASEVDGYPWASDDATAPVEGLPPLTDTFQNGLSTPLQWWWAVAIILFFMAPVYVWLSTKNTSKPAPLSQILVAAPAFVVWVAGLGLLMDLSFTWFRPYMGSTILVIGSLLVPLLALLVSKILKEETEA